MELLPASEGGAHGRAFPGLIRLGPGVNDGCNLGNAAYIVRHDGAGEGDRQAPRVRRILDALASVPVRNLDGVFNLAMDEIKVYATSRPLAHVAEAKGGGETTSVRREGSGSGSGSGKRRRCRCAEGGNGEPGGCSLSCLEEPPDY